MKTKKINEEATPPLSTLLNLLYIAIFSAILIPKISFSDQAPSFTFYLIVFWIGWTKIVIIYYGAHIILRLVHWSQNKSQV